MKTNRTILILSLLALACTFSTAHALPVVEWGTTYLGYGSGLFTLSSQASWADAVCQGSYIQEASGWWTTVTADRGFLDPQFRWFETDYGDLIDWDSAMSAPAFADNVNSEYGSFHLNFEESLYLGYVVYQDLPLSPVKLYEYGWAQLSFDGVAVNVTSSAAERTGLGIYAGTGTAVPEPATMGLLGVGALALIWRKRKR